MFLGLGQTCGKPETTRRAGSTLTSATKVLKRGKSMARLSTNWKLNVDVGVLEIQQRRWRVGLSACWVTWEVIIKVTRYPRSCTWPRPAKTRSDDDGFFSCPNTWIGAVNVKVMDL